MKTIFTKITKFLGIGFIAITGVSCVSTAAVQENYIKMTEDEMEYGAWAASDKRYQNGFIPEHLTKKLIDYAMNDAMDKPYAKWSYDQKMLQISIALRAAYVTIMSTTGPKRKFSMFTMKNNVVQLKYHYATRSRTMTLKDMYHELRELYRMGKMAGTYGKFSQAVADVSEKDNLEVFKLMLITNVTGYDRLEFLEQNKDNEEY